MQYAIYEGTKQLARPNLVGTCPLCQAGVRAKCGAINVRHWAHISLVECDAWWEPESEWHRWWKTGLPAARVEVTIGKHRADIVTSRGTVVELQSSSISPAEIAERELAYGNMVWLFDGSDLLDGERLLLRPKFDSVCTFRWKHPRKHYGYCQKPVFIDLGEEVMLLRKLHLDGGPPYGGWGQMIDLESMRAWIAV